MLPFEASRRLTGANLFLAATGAQLETSGITVDAALLDGLAAWMDRKGIESVAGIRGLLAPAADTAQPGFGRYGYLRAVERASRVYSPGSALG